MFSWTSGSDPLVFRKEFDVNVNECFLEIILIYLNVLTVREK